MKIFDIHTHVYPDAIAEKAVAALGKFYNFVPQGKGTYDDMTEADRKSKVSGFLVFSVATNAHQIHRVNECLIETMKRGREDGFEAYAFGGMHQDCDDMEAEINYAINGGLCGIKIHPDIQGEDIDSRKFYPLYEIAEGRFPIYFHMGDDRPQYRFSSAYKLKKVLSDFPRLKVVAAHLGGYKAGDDERFLFCGNENVYYDTSSALWYLSPGQAEQIIGRLGYGRVMFGTDYPVMKPEAELMLFDRLRLPDKVKEDILYNNAIRFLSEIKA